MVSVRPEVPEGSENSHREIGFLYSSRQTQRGETRQILYKRSVSRPVNIPKGVNERKNGSSDGTRRTMCDRLLTKSIEQTKTNTLHFLIFGSRSSVDLHLQNLGSENRNSTVDPGNQSYRRVVTEYYVTLLQGFTPGF